MGGVLAGFFTIGCLIATGMLLAHFHVMDAAAQQLLARISFFVAGPALLMVTVADADVQELLSRNLVATASAVVIVAIVYLAIARASFQRSAADSTMAILCASYVNSANLGIPIAAYVLGDAALVAPTLLLQLLVIQPIALGFLDAAEHDGPHSWGKILRSPFTNPVTLGTLAGLVVAVSPLTIPPQLRDPLELLGGMSIPGMLLAFGVSLRLNGWPGRSEDTPELLWITLLKLVAEPLAAFLVGRYVLGLDDRGLLAVTVLAALPTAQNIFVLALRYDRRVILTRDAIFATTLLSAPAIFVIAAILR